MATAFKELSGSPLETYDSSGLQATRLFLCAWDDRRALLMEIIGEGTAYGGDGPKPYPGFATVLPVRVRIEPFTDDVSEQELTDLSVGLNTYGGFAKLTVDYRYVQIDWPGASEIELQEYTYLSAESHGAAEAMLTKGQPLYWYNGGSPEAVTEDDLYVVHRVPVVEHRVTWHFVLSPNMELIRKIVGMVCASDLWGTAAETLLFDSYSIRREFTVLDDLTQPINFYQVTYVFRERRVPHLQAWPAVGGWNTYYRSKPAADAGWDKLQNADGSPVYQLATSTQFENLFKYGEAT